jgi:hypothetical protein
MNPVVEAQVCQCGHSRAYHARADVGRVQKRVGACKYGCGCPAYRRRWSRTGASAYPESSSSRPQALDGMAGVLTHARESVQQLHERLQQLKDGGP